ncbi:Bifunctional homocysteine S-methyltransferase/5,10-methylenetetrahydrofolate reductase [bacterium HR33]|nr:Bifunctional homocysteine S-methyltransferase/5,10-methylenetetrahydrofolate reductase [bacterium HR33]
MAPTLRDFLADGKVHLFDGAMGTMLYSKGVFVNVCYDELNLKQPRLVQSIHEEYVRAGAELLETNTFGANPVKLAGYGLADLTEEINRKAAEIARKAANGKAAVVGAIGPLGIRIEPFGPTSREEAREFFQRQVKGLLEGGVSGFVLETFADLEELRQALEAVRSLCDLPVIAQVTVNEEGRTAYGTDVEAVAARLHEWGAEVIGCNCSVGPAYMLDAVERMAKVTDRPLSAQPNAGLPRSVGDRKIYLSSPEYMASYARRLVEAGAHFVGGCCGTTPEHIRKMRAALAQIERGKSFPVPYVSPPVSADGREAVPLANRSKLGEKLASGSFITTVELLPPKGWVPDRLIEQARILRSAGIDAVSLLEGPRALSRMGAIPAAIIVQRQAGVEAIVHYTCRDRTMLGMLSDLLGAAAAGIRNLLLVTGDPPRAETAPSQTGIFDIDSIGLTNLVFRLNRGLDPGGNSIGEPTRYVIGVAVNPWAADLDHELRRFYWKVDAGAEFAVTQPVFEPERLEEFLKRTEEFRIPVLAGIWPLLSLRNAEFLAHEVPGIHVPEPIIDRMRRAQERGAEFARAEGVAIAREMVEQVRGLVNGIQISTPLGRVDSALQVLGAEPTG